MLCQYLRLDASHTVRDVGAVTATLENRLRAILQADALAAGALAATQASGLAEAWVVSGALYNAVWNALTDRPSGYGVKDVDIAYFDAADLSYEAEDRAISAAAPHFAGLAAPVEIRNQARVHLWFEARFGRAYPPLASATDGLTRYPSRTHAVAARLGASGAVEIRAPFGLEDVFAMRVTPNRAFDNRATHEEKAARARRFWPEVTIEPW